MVKIWFYLILTVVFHVTAFGQFNYFATDIELKTGIKLIDGGDIENAKFCQVKRDNEIKKYSPFEVSEYGFKDGRVYFSKNIRVSDSVIKVFLNCLYKGEISLYYYRSKRVKTFFLERDSSGLMEILKHSEDGNYKKQINEITNDCEDIADAVKLFSYNKKSFTELVKRFDQCQSRPFPHLRFGASYGLDLSKPKSSPESQIIQLKNLDFTFEKGFLLSLFIDFPLFVSDYSLHVDLTYSNHSYSYNKMINDKDIDFIANTSSFKLPVLIRYTYPSNKLRPFFDAGAVVALNYGKDDKLYEAFISQDIIEIQKIGSSSFVSDYMGGFSTGTGIEYKINLRNSLFLELRYLRLYTDHQYLGESLIQLKTGIVF